MKSDKSEKKCQEFIKVNCPVYEIDNANEERIVVKTKLGSFTCSKVLFGVPIATSNKIKISKISKSKQLLLDNQENGKITRKYLVFKEAFWRIKFSGYGSFSNKFPFN